MVELRDRHAHKFDDCRPKGDCHILGAIAGGLAAGIGGSLFGGGGGGGGGGGDQTVTQTPWDPAQGPLKDILNEAGNLYQTTPAYYPGPTVAPFAPAQLASQNYLQQYAQGVQPYINQAQGTSAFMQDPNMMLNVGNNPYIQGMGDAIGNQLVRATNKVMGNIRSGSVASGTLGGSRQALAQRGALQDMNESYGNTLAKLYGGAYGQGLGAVNTAQGMAGQMAGLGAYPAELMSGVGAQQRAYDQQMLGATQAPWQYYEGAPRSNLGWYHGLAGQIGGMGSSSNTSVADPEFGLKDALGLGLLGYSAFDSMGGGGSGGFNFSPSSVRNVGNVNFGNTTPAPAPGFSNALSWNQF